MTDWPSDWPMSISMEHFLDCQLMEEGPGIMDITILGQVGLCCEEWWMGMSLEGNQEAAFVVSDSEASASIDDVSLEASQEAAFVVSDSVLASASTDDGLKLVN